MKKTRPASRTPKSEEDMPREFHFDYEKAKPNRFLRRIAQARASLLAGKGVKLESLKPERKTPGRKARKAPKR